MAAEVIHEACFPDDIDKYQRKVNDTYIAREMMGELSVLLSLSIFISASLSLSLGVTVFVCLCVCVLCV